jgi:hypothetical protein
MLVGVGVTKELAAEESAAEERAEKQARLIQDGSGLKIENVDPTLLAEKQADLAKAIEKEQADAKIAMSEFGGKLVTDSIERSAAADAKKAELQAEIDKLQEGPEAGENFQESRAARKEANTPKEYTIKVYGKFDQTFTVDKDSKIFDRNGKEIRPEDDPKYYLDIEKRIREARKSEERGAPEVATETVSEDPEINYAIGFAKENGLTFNKRGVLRGGGSQDDLAEAMEGVFPGLWKTDGDFDLEKIEKIEAKIAKFIKEYLANGENPDWFKE